LFQIGRFLKIFSSETALPNEPKLGKGHSNDHSFSLGSVSSFVSEKKIFEISANQRENVQMPSSQKLQI
jgi:hypothetical protein